MKKTIVSLTAEKDGMDFYLTIKADKKLENLFKTISENQTSQSTKWLDNNNTGLQFYVKNDKMAEMLNKTAIYSANCDDFGSSLIKNGEYNFAVIRAKGISSTGGIKMKATEIISYDELKNYIEKLGQFIKTIYQNNLTKTKIKAKITFDI